MILWTRILGQPKIFSGSPSISPEEGGEREGESGKKERKSMKGKESDSRRENLREKEKESLALPFSRADLKREVLASPKYLRAHLQSLLKRERVFLFPSLFLFHFHFLSLSLPLPLPLPRSFPPVPTGHDNALFAAGDDGVVRSVERGATVDVPPSGKMTFLGG